MRTAPGITAFAVIASSAHRVAASTAKSTLAVLDCPYANQGLELFTE